MITGYNENTIHNWIHHGHLRYLDCIVGWRIPKVWMIDFLCSPYCNGIARKTDLHVSFIADMIQAAEKSSKNQREAFDALPSTEIITEVLL